MTNSQPTNGSAPIDPAFTSIPKNKPALLVWRVENMQLVPVPSSSIGVFFKGDSYLVYASEAKKTSSSSFSVHVHLWIGSESSVDEQGVGAYKMVELDTYLNGVAIQHRECENFESDRFLSYFKDRGGLKYQVGGVASGFNHYEKSFQPRAFQVKGKRNVRLSELTSIEWATFNRFDSFLIDLNTVIFIWNGRSANKFEKLKAMEKARQFRDERKGECNIVMVEDGDERLLAKDELQLFETYLPLREKQAQLKNESSTKAAQSKDDAQFEAETAAYLKLYKCSDAIDDLNGTIKIQIIEQKNGPLFKEDLDSESSFIIDNGKAGVWVWIGKKSSVKERQEAMRNALGFLQARGFDEKQQNSIRVTRVNEGAEPVEFRVLFNRWPLSNEQKGLGVTHSVNKVAKVAQVNFDAATMHANPQLAAETQMVDDGRGEKLIWFVHKFDTFALDTSKYGDFHTGDCYLIHYKYKVNNAERHILYYWIGRKSTMDEQGTVSLKTIEYDNKQLGGQALQVRVTEGKEPAHFMAMFGGRIIIYQGGKASGFHNVPDAVDSDVLPDNYMLQIRSTNSNNTKALQVDYKASSLNSNDVFIICYKKTKFYIWCGKGCTGDERETAKSILQAQKREPEMVFESQEKADFWAVLGGKQEYFSDKRLAQTQCATSARLFEISNASGRIDVQEIYDFTQDDLDPNEVMLLDAWDAIFLWIGVDANKTEIDESARIVQDYLKEDPSQRGLDTLIYKVKQSFEPDTFIGFFGPWDPKAFRTAESMDYNTVKAELESRNQLHLFKCATKDKTTVGGSTNGVNGGATTRVKDNGMDTGLAFSQYPKYPFEELIKPADELAARNINAELREVYLSEADFEKAFKMTYAQFLQKPAWKQKELKRALHLF